jgi:hypothetical protein
MSFIIKCWINVVLNFFKEKANWVLTSLTESVVPWLKIQIHPKHCHFSFYKKKKKTTACIVFFAKPSFDGVVVETIKSTKSY